MTTACAKADERDLDVVFSRQNSAENYEASGGKFDFWEQWLAGNSVFNCMFFSLPSKVLTKIYYFRVEDASSSTVVKAMHTWLKQR